jgi:hypothetical protein
MRLARETTAVSVELGSLEEWKREEPVEVFCVREEEPRSLLCKML